MATASHIFHVYFTKEQQPVLLRCLRPAFCNAHQSCEDQATHDAHTQHEQLRAIAEQHHGPLSYKGKLEGTPLGDALYATGHTPILLDSLFIGDLPQGHPWIYLAAAATKADVLQALQEDVQDGYHTKDEASFIAQSLQRYTHGLLLHNHEQK